MIFNFKSQVFYTTINHHNTVSEKQVPLVKFVLGKGEIEILRTLKSPRTHEKILDALLSKRVLDAKAACKKAIKSLNNKKLIELGEKVKLTDAGKLQREVLLMTGVITE